jgi:hypothetical protein
MGSKLPCSTPPDTCNSYNIGMPCFLNCVVESKSVSTHEALHYHSSDLPAQECNLRDVFTLHPHQLLSSRHVRSHDRDIRM